MGSSSRTAISREPSPRAAGAVGLVVANADRHACNALASAVGAFTGAEFGGGLEVVDLFNAVLDEERLGEALQLELAHAAVKLRKHGFEDGIFFGVGAGGLSVRCGCEENSDKDGEHSEWTHSKRAHHPPTTERQPQILRLRSGLTSFGRCFAQDDSRC